MVRWVTVQETHRTEAEVLTRTGQQLNSLEACMSRGVRRLSEEGPQFGGGVPQRCKEMRLHIKDRHARCIAG